MTVCYLFRFCYESVQNWKSADQYFCKIYKVTNFTFYTQKIQSIHQYKILTLPPIVVDYFIVHFETVILTQLQNSNCFMFTQKSIDDYKIAMFSCLRKRVLIFLLNRCYLMLTQRPFDIVTE